MKGTGIRRTFILAGLWASIAAAAAAVAHPEGLPFVGGAAVPVAALLLMKLRRPGCRQCGAEGTMSVERLARAVKEPRLGWQVVREEISRCSACGWQGRKEVRESSSEEAARTLR